MRGEAHAGGLERGDLLRRRALAARNDGARVPHALPFGRGLPGDEPDHRLRHLAADEGRGFLLGRAADLADHDDGVRAGVGLEEPERVDESRADDGIAADADAGRLPDAEPGELVHGLVRERAAARHDADASGRVDVGRHDADLAFAGRDDAGTVGSDEPRGGFVEHALDAHHVEDRDAFGDADDERDARVDGFENAVAGAGRRHVDDRRVGSRLPHGLGDRVEDRDALEIGAGAARRDAGHHLRAVLAAEARVQLARRSGDALRQHAGRSIDEDAHARLAAATAFSAPSRMSSAVITSIRLSARICFPRSTFVPSMRTTSGTDRPSSRAASTTPSASTSQRRMPPKMLMKMARTALSDSRIRKAAFTFSVLAPPPTSRKFAGSPPADLTLSTVAMASAAAFTMQPMSPSSAMYERSCLAASVSRGSSSEGSRNSRRSAWRKSPLSSTDTFASSAIKSPASVTISGLHSTSEQSHSTRQR